MTTTSSTFDKLFRHMVPTSMEGIQIFSMDDNYIKPQQYNDVTNLENGIWEDLFINVAPLIDQ